MEDGDGEFSQFFVRRESSLEESLRHSDYDSFVNCDLLATKLRLQGIFWSGGDNALRGSILNEKVASNVYQY